MYDFERLNRLRVFFLYVHITRKCDFYSRCIQKVNELLFQPINACNTFNSNTFIMQLATMEYIIKAC